jgi:long-chain fatty acid transport protein
MKLLPALIATAFAGSASAAGFQLLEQTASGIGNAYAGSAAVAENASTIFYNPAGMTQLKDHEASFGLTAIKPSFKFHNNGSTSGTLAGAGDGGDAGQWGWVPNGYLSWALNKDLYVGIGLGAPFGLMTDYDSPWKGSAQSNKFDVKTYNINPSVAWKVNDTVSVGAGLNWQRLTAEYQRQLAIVPTVPPGLPGNTPLTLKVDDNAWGWNAGALFHLTPVTKLGLSYRSKINYSATGQITGGSPSPVVNGAVGANVKASISMPDTFIASLSHQLTDRWEVLGDISWTGWSSIPKIDIVRTSGAAAGTVAQTLNTDFRDTWRFALGGTYKINDAWKWKVGIAYDETPVKGASTRLASLPDNDRIWLSTGAQWKVSQNSTLDFGLTYLYLKDADINNNQLTSGQGTLNGTYKDSGWLAGLQYSVSF